MNMTTSPLSTASLIYRRFIPEPHLRTPLTPYNAFVLIIPMLPMVLMGYLVRRPNTHLLRMMLCPLVVLLNIQIYFSYYWVNPRFTVYNWGLSLIAITMVARTLEFAFIPKGRLKIGEISPGLIVTPAIEKDHPHINGNGNANGTAHVEIRQSSSPVNTIWQGFVDSLEVLCAMRGVNWVFGKDVYVPPAQQTIRRLVKTMALSFLALDFLESIVKSFPQFQDPSGGSLWEPAYPPIQRFVRGTFIHLLTGSCVIAGFEMLYALLGLLSILILRHEPSSWPDPFDNPWVSTSLHEFWAKRWHQLLRQTFLVFGGYPLSCIFSFNRTLANTGLVMGTFIASGLFHNLSMYTMGQGMSNHILIFFAGQGVAVIGERIWRKVTGKRVGGTWGMVWVYANIMIGGQPCVDAWHRKGLASGLIIPPEVSPTRQLLWPLLIYLLKK